MILEYLQCMYTLKTHAKNVAVQTYCTHFLDFKETFYIFTALALILPRHLFILLSSDGSNGFKKTRGNDKDGAT